MVVGWGHTYLGRRVDFLEAGKSGFLEAGKSRFVGIPEFGDLEIQKYWVKKMENIQILKIQIRSICVATGTKNECEGNWHNESTKD